MYITYYTQIPQINWLATHLKHAVFDKNKICNVYIAICGAIFIYTCE